MYRTILPLWSRIALALVAALWVAAVPASAPAGAQVEGMVVKPSPHSVKETLDRLEAALKEKGIQVALRWDHAARAKAVGIELRPTELLVFGNPRLGSHLFTAGQTAGIDLPMKALAWEDARGQVWLGYNDPDYIASRHHVTGRDAVLARMKAALDRLSDRAVAP